MNRKMTLSLCHSAGVLHIFMRVGASVGEYCLRFGCAITRERTGPAVQGVVGRGVLRCCDV